MADARYVGPLAGTQGQLDSEGQDENLVELNSGLDTAPGGSMGTGSWQLGIFCACPGQGSFNEVEVE